MKKNSGNKIEIKRKDGRKDIYEIVKKENNLVTLGNGYFNHRIYVSQNPTE